MGRVRLGCWLCALGISVACGSSGKTAGELGPFANIVTNEPPPRSSDTPPSTYENPGSGYETPPASSDMPPSSTDTPGNGSGGCPPCNVELVDCTGSQFSAYLVSIDGACVFTEDESPPSGDTSNRVVLGCGGSVTENGESMGTWSVSGGAYTLCAQTTNGDACASCSTAPLPDGGFEDVIVLPGAGSAVETFP
jgi:hypothetical protein